jgi:YetA-like protein
MKLRFNPGLCSAFIGLLSAPFTLAASVDPVQIGWLGGTPSTMSTGVSWGVPWPKGAVPKDQKFSLTTADGKTLPLQTWPLAYWPDGSLKWSGFASAAGPEQGASFKLSPAAATASGATDGAKVTLQESNGTIDIDTGVMKARLRTSGANLIESISIAGREVARAGQLVCFLQNGPDVEEGAGPAREKFLSNVHQVVVEQSGPVRAVVKIDGMHQAVKGAREWLPFSVRLYFYAGEESIRVVHTITFDGDQEKDFIRGLGLTFGVPLREGLQNRHVRFVGADGGLWAEPIQAGPGNAAQAAGQSIPGGRNYGEHGEEGGYAIWSDFKLTQPNPEGFTVSKRTNPQSTWIFSDAGTRSAGLVFIGDVAGGLGISLKNFWQSYPTGLEVRDMAKASAQLTTWLWSPDGPAMDMRHYDVKAHGLGPTYEDVQPGMSKAYGVARTSELTLYPRGDLPAKALTVAMAKAGAEPALLAASPQYLQSTGVFGVWSLPDRSTPLKAAVEDKLASTLKYYQQQVDERHWYGFWTFGDYIHSYNNAQHVWYYDYGGHAWQNTELGQPLWVWYSFLRTGRADIFRMAEALTRNTSETNVYHLGPMSGLGSRHNVVKWGDGAKEARVSQAAHWRPFYYLTTDERTGDIMRAQLISDSTAMRFDPMRLAQPSLPQDPKFPGRIRIGPDWLALAGNWMTEWERTGDTKWRDKIIAGVDSILAMKYWMKSGVFNGLNPDLPKNPDGTPKLGPLKGGGSMTVGYDPATGKLFPIPDPIAKEQVPVNYNLFTIQGGAQVMFELVPLLGREDFAKAWLQYSRLSVAPGDVLLRDKETGTEGADGQFVEGSQGGPRLAAYAYAHTKNPAFARIAIAALSRYRSADSVVLKGPDVLNPVHEAPGIATNNAAQDSLSMIEILALCADALPNELPPAPPEGGRGGRGGRGNAGAGGTAPVAAPPAKQ